MDLADPDSIQLHSCRRAKATRFHALPQRRRSSAQVTAAPAASPLAALLARQRVAARGLSAAFVREVWGLLDRAARSGGSSLGPPRVWQLSQLALMLDHPRSAI